MDFCMKFYYLTIVVTVYMITINLIDWQSVGVPEDERIRVRPDDIIGIQYTYTEDGIGVVPYEQSDKTSTAGVSPEQLSRFVNGKNWDAGLPIGVTKTIDIFYLKRLPALKPITKCCVETNNLEGMFQFSNFIRVFRWLTLSWPSNSIDIVNNPTKACRFLIT